MKADAPAAARPLSPEAWAMAAVVDWWSLVMSRECSLSSEVSG